MKKQKRFMILLQIFGVALGIFYLSPFYMVVVNSFKTKKNVLIDNIGIPDPFVFENYPKAMDKMDFLQAFTNSILITVVSIGLLVVFSSMSAWVLVRTKNRASGLVFMLFVAAMLIPFQSVMLPLVNLFGADNLNLVNTRIGIVIMYIGFGSSLSIFLFHGFIKGIPIDLENAAIIDGCTKFQVYRKIVLPLLKPISVTVMILNGIWIWNDFLLPSLVLQQRNLRTLPLAAQYFFGAFSKDWHLAMAALTLAIIPVVIFYLLAQKQIIKGVMAGSIK